MLAPRWPAWMEIGFFLACERGRLVSDTNKPRQRHAVACRFLRRQRACPVVFDAEPTRCSCPAALGSASGGQGASLFPVLGALPAGWPAGVAGPFSWRLIRAPGRGDGSDGPETRLPLGTHAAGCWRRWVEPGPRFTKKHGVSWKKRPFEWTILTLCRSRNWLGQASASPCFREIISAMERRSVDRSVGREDTGFPWQIPTVECDVLLESGVEWDGAAVPSGAFRPECARRVETGARRRISGPLTVAKGVLKGCRARETREISEGDPWASRRPSRPSWTVR